MFYKIPLNLNSVDLERIKGQPIQKYGPSNAKLTHYTIADLEYFKSLHVGKIKFHIMPNSVFYTEIQGTEPIPPHVDPDDSVALNYYIDPVGCTTTFYKMPDYDKKYSTSGQDLNPHDHRIVKSMKFDDLVVNCAFVAQAGEAYLLRPDVYHSVTTPVGIRKFISYRWGDIDFETVYKSIQIIS